MFSRLSRGQRLLFAGRFARAAEVLGRAAEAAPRNPWPRLYRAIALGWLGRRDEAAEEAARAAAHARRPAPACFLAALLAADAGRHPEARDLVARGEADDRRNPYGAGIRAFVALREGDGGAAVKRLLALDLPPHDEYMLRVLRFMEEPKRPLFAPVPPGSVPPASLGWQARWRADRLVKEGSAQVYDDQYAKGVEALREAVALAPEDTTARACYGEALYLAGDREGAERELLQYEELARREHLKGDVQAAAVEGYLGRIDYFAGRAERASERLARAVEAGSPYPDDRYFLALCHWWRGEPREAYLAWNRVRVDDVDFLRRRLRELLGLPRGQQPGPFDWIGALRAPQEVAT